MRYSFALPGVPTSPLELEVNALTGGMRLYANGAELPREKGRIPVFMVPQPGGQPLPVTVRLTLAGLGQPTIEWGPNSIKIGTPIPNWGWPLVALPFGLIFVGGALGGLCGAGGAYVNAAILRSEMPTALKVLASLGVLVATALVYLVLATIILGALKH